MKKGFSFQARPRATTTVFPAARRRVCPPDRLRAQAREDADALLAAISECSTSAELLEVLRSNEQVILGGTSETATTYLSEAWELLLESSINDSNNRLLQGYMLEHTMPRVDQFSPSSISMIARAMVATKTGAAADLVLISSDIQSRMVHFEPRELCMALWAMSSHPGTSEAQKQALFKSLATLVRRGMGMDNFTAKDLSILVWAVGHVAYRDRVLLDAAEREAVKKHGDFTAEDLSRWALRRRRARACSDSLTPSVSRSHTHTRSRHAFRSLLVRQAVPRVCVCELQPAFPSPVCLRAVFGAGRVERVRQSGPGAVDRVAGEAGGRAAERVLQGVGVSGEGPRAGVVQGELER